MASSPQALAEKLIAILDRDSDRLVRIDQYLAGIQDDPYMPTRADDEYKLLAKRSVSNWMPLLVSTPAQALYVDGFRRGFVKGQESRQTGDSPEWDWWQTSRMDARQAAVYRGALTFGHAFVLTEKAKNKVTIRGLSSMNTAALFEDPANDETPYAVLTIDSRPGAEAGSRGAARLWDGLYAYPVTLRAGDKPIVHKGVLHGSKECPVTRFAASVDLEGRTIGVVEPMIPLQNRINQTVFDLLVAQTYGSFKVRWATGMAPPIIRDAEGEPVLDSHGQPQPLPIDLNAKRFLFGEDDGVRFGSLDETPLDGYIASIDMSIRHLAAVSQTPPHHLLGQIANLSAEALAAAETSLSRKIEEFRKGFGESWERVFRLAAELTGDGKNAANFSGEVVWRDMEQRSLQQSADSLGKFAESLDIPKRGLWPRVPGVTQTELDEWAEMRKEDDTEGALAAALLSANPDNATSVPFPSDTP